MTCLMACVYISFSSLHLNCNASLLVINIANELSLLENVWLKARTRWLWHHLGKSFYKGLLGKWVSYSNHPVCLLMCLLVCLSVCQPKNLFRDDKFSMDWLSVFQLHIRISRHSGKTLIDFGVKMSQVRVV